MNEIEEYLTPKNLLLAGAAYYAFYYVGREGYLGPTIQRPMVQLHIAFMQAIGQPLTPEQRAQYGV